MKTLLTSIFILISTLGYTQKINLSDLNIDSLNSYVVSYMNDVRDSLIDSHIYETNTRYVKRKGTYVTDTVGVSMVLINKLSIDEKLSKASQNQANYMLSVNHVSHEQPAILHGVKSNVDTLLFDLIDRMKYFNTEIKSEICLQAAYGYNDGKYFQSFDGMNSTEIYKAFAKYIIDLYLSSPGHRRAVLSNNYKTVGISIAYTDESRVFSTIVFN